MSATKFTPGPWNPSTFGFQVLTGDSWNSICELRGGAEWEDGRGKYVLEYEWQNQESNARLIAAAPDLFAALEAIADFCDDPNGSENPESLAMGLARMLPAARAALSKANPVQP